MQVSEVDADVLRRLAELRAPEGTRVLSLYLNLDPSEIPTGEARATAITSVVDDARRRAEDADLGHDARIALREDVERAREALTSDDLPQGAHGLAVFAAKPANLFEVLRLPRHVDNDVAVAPRAHIEPLAPFAEREPLAIVLADRREGRILVGTRDALVERKPIRDDTHGQHDQGGWSQLRYERSVEEEAQAHVRRVVDALVRRHDEEPFAHVLLGAPDEVIGALRDALPQRLRERVAGRIAVSVSPAQATSDDVLGAALEQLDHVDRAREREALDRVAAGLGSPGGHAVAGLDEVLRALEERRVETLLYSDAFAAGDGNADTLDEAIAATVAQSAHVMRVRFHDDLDALGGVAALLRF
jgi:peptide chain release factor subunit 1